MVAEQRNYVSDGIVFVVGMPRSGTKLLASVVGRHPRIARANVETDFLPLWIEAWPRYGDLSDREAFARFYRSAVRLPYFLAMKGKGRLIPEETWYERCREFTVAGVFDALLRHDTGAGDDWSKMVVDKSPSYTRHVGLLGRHFPGARFIHIVRDVRDYCLSMHRAWGKNMVRAAYRWSKDVQKARREGKEMGNDYIEVKYEELLEDPRTIIERICAFLHSDFNERMLVFSKPTEYVGSAKGSVGIKKDNIQKYLRQMNPRTRRTIEEITGPVLRSLGYPVDYDGEALKIGGVRMAVYRFADALIVLKSSIREKGILNAVRLNLRALITRR